MYFRCLLLFSHVGIAIGRSPMKAIMSDMYLKIGCSKLIMNRTDQTDLWKKNDTVHQVKYYAAYLKLQHTITKVASLTPFIILYIPQLWPSMNSIIPIHCLWCHTHKPTNDWFTELGCTVEALQLPLTWVLRSISWRLTTSSTCRFEPEVGGRVTGFNCSKWSRLMSFTFLLPSIFFFSYFIAARWSLCWLPLANCCQSIFELPSWLTTQHRRLMEGTH